MLPTPTPYDLTFSSLLASTVSPSSDVPHTSLGIFLILLFWFLLLSGMAQYQSLSSFQPSGWLMASLLPGSKSHRMLEIPSISPSQPPLLNSRHKYPIVSLTYSPECLLKTIFQLIFSIPSVGLELMSFEIKSHMLFQLSLPGTPSLKCLLGISHNIFFPSHEISVSLLR